jgi:single-strand DNA-binding protein
MDLDINTLTLTGALTRDPQTRFSDHGTQMASFTICVLEAGPAGQEFKLYVPIEAYGQAAAVAGDLRSGAAVLVVGKLKWPSATAKDGTKKSTLAVLARQVRQLPAAPVATGAPAHNN